MRYLFSTVMWLYTLSRVQFTILVAATGISCGQPNFGSGITVAPVEPFLDLHCESLWLSVVYFTSVNWIST